METKKLAVIETLAEGLKIGLKNLPSLILATLLWVLTIWIPYLNVGTTIAMQTIPGRLAKGEIISPLFIFESKYRRDIAGFLLLFAFVYFTTYMAGLFMVIPAIVVSYALSLAFYIFVDEDVNAIEALRLSNKATYGNKWNLFFIGMMYLLLVVAVTAVLVALTYKVTWLCVLICIALALVCVAAGLGIDAVIYNELYLKEKASNEPAAE